jgi:hypothetical protein
MTEMASNTLMKKVKDLDYKSLTFSLPCSARDALKALDQRFDAKTTEIKRPGREFCAWRILKVNGIELCIRFLTHAPNPNRNSVCISGPSGPAANDSYVYAFVCEAFMYLMNTLRHHQEKTDPDRFEEANKFIDLVEALTQGENYDYYDSDLPHFSLMTNTIAYALPTVMVSRMVSDEAERVLAYMAENHWNENEFGDYRLEDDVERIMQLKIKLQRCAKRFVARKLLSKLI